MGAKRQSGRSSPGMTEGAKLSGVPEQQNTTVAENWGRSLDRPSAREVKRWTEAERLLYLRGIHRTNVRLKQDMSKTPEWASNKEA